MTSVSAVMTPNPAACTINTPVRDVARMMLENDCGQIPVVDDQSRPLGVVTDRDIALRVVANGGGAMSTAGDVMTSPAQSVRADSNLKDCVCIMEEAQVRRVPVVDAFGKLTGMVALADIALAGKHKVTAEIVSQVSQPVRTS